MFPLKDDVPSSRFPSVTIGIIAVNALLFLLQMSLGPHQIETFVHEHGFVPARFLAEDPAGGLLPAGATTLISSMFLHGGLFHLFANMWMLWIFGDNVEDRLGHGRYLFFYLLCGVAAALAQYWSNPLSRVPMIGASGAISGVVGGYFLLFPRARILTFVPIFIFFYLVEVPAYVFIGFWFVMQFLQGALAQVGASGDPGQGGVAWWAHVGGFVAGVILLKLFMRAGRRRGQVWL